MQTGGVTGSAASHENTIVNMKKKKSRTSHCKTRHWKSRRWLTNVHVGRVGDFFAAGQNDSLESREKSHCSLSLCMVNLTYKL